MPVKLNSSGGGSVTLTTPSTASNYTATFPATTGNVVLSDTSGTATVTDFYATNVYASGTVQMGSSFKRNRIINGDMRVDQRNAGASVTPTTSGTYTIDRWVTYLSQASKFSVQQNAGSVTPPVGFSKYLGITSLAATSLGATDYFNFAQTIEGFNCADFAWGTANAKAITISFWVYSSLTGTFGGVVQNNSGTRFYPFSYTISSTNTWEYKTITVSGDTSGTWPTDNSGSVQLRFSVGTGSTYSGTAGSWGATTYASVTGATSVVGVNGATFYITGVQLEVGSVATPYERQIYSDQLAQCQRYYYRYTAAASDYLGMAYGISATVAYVFVRFPVTMRIAPTAVEQSGTATNYLVSRCGAAANTTCSSVPTINAAYTWGAVTNFNVASGLLNNNAGSGYTTAYLGWSAEL